MKYALSLAILLFGIAGNAATVVLNEVEYSPNNVVKVLSTNTYTVSDAKMVVPKGMGATVEIWANGSLVCDMDAKTFLSDFNIPGLQMLNDLKFPYSNLVVVCERWSLLPTRSFYAVSIELK